MRSRAPRVLLPLATLLLAACAGRPPVPVDGRPLEVGPAERALWARAEREGEALLQRTRAYDDPALPPYLLALAGVPAPAAAVPGRPVLRVQVVRDPMLNAFALPDGLLLVHTGLLAAVERPAELALLLAREVAHVTHRHALAIDRAGRVRPPRHVEMGPTGPVAAAILGDRLSLAGTVAITGYPEALEREADRSALERIGLAGVDTAAAGEVFMRLAQRARMDEGDEIFLLTRPAWLDERQQSVARLLTPPPVTPVVDAAAQADFDIRLRPIVRENAVEEIRRGRYAAAGAALDRVLAAAPRDAVAHVYYGDLHRLQGQHEGSPAARLAQAERARAHYARAMELDPMLAAPHRQLGLLHYGLGDRAGARADFERYLALAPDAPDAARIAEYVRELDR